MRARQASLQSFVKWPARQDNLSEDSCENTIALSPQHEQGYNNGQCTALLHEFVRTHVCKHRTRTKHARIKTMLLAGLRLMLEEGTYRLASFPSQ